jgi:hypothetical protein
MQQATWTEGPSLPTDKPDAITRGLVGSELSILKWLYRGVFTSVMNLMKNVANPRNPCITKPARMHFISDIPDPAAYFANERTRCAAMKENNA